MNNPLVVLGLGNLLMSDDGIGVRAIEMLQRRFGQVRDVAFVDGGTLGLSLVPVIEDADTVLLIDAVRTNDAPGRVVRLDGERIPHALDARLSPHELGVSDLLLGAQLGGRPPRRTVLLGIVPARIELGTELSPEVERSLPQLIDRIVDEVRALGHALEAA